MTRSRGEESVWESTGMKITVTAVFLVFFGAIFYLQIRPDRASTTDSMSAKPAVRNVRRQTPPVPAVDSSTSQPSYVPNSPYTPYTPYSSETSVSMPSQQLPPHDMPIKTGSTRSPGAPYQEPKTEAIPLSAPVTQVHSINDAEEVMGTSVSGAGKIGVTQTFKLPDPNSASIGQPVPQNEKLP